MTFGFERGTIWGNKTAVCHQGTAESPPKMPLTDPACRNAKCPAGKARERYTDSGGLYLEVQPTGAKHWRWKYRFAGKEKRIALGTYPAVSLKKAREDRDTAREKLKAGTDPVQAKRDEKLASRVRHGTPSKLWLAPGSNTGAGRSHHGTPTTRIKDGALATILQDHGSALNSYTHGGMYQLHSPAQTGQCRADVRRDRSDRGTCLRELRCVVLAQRSYGARPSGTRLAAACCERLTEDASGVARPRSSGRSGQPPFRFG